MEIVPANTKLTARSPGIPAWGPLEADHKKVAAHIQWAVEADVGEPVLAGVGGYL
jgi:hypothetical protein